MNVKLGDYIYNDLSSNEYLNKLYSTILIKYSQKILNTDYNKNNNINLDDALHFADILSKSTSKDHSEIHRIWAQEIISLLDTLYPNNSKIKYFAGSIYNNTCNFRGLDIINPNYESYDLLEDAYNIMNRKYLQIQNNNSEKMYFFKEQKIAYNSLNQRGFSYSGPTSLGKSFVIKNYIVNNIINNYKENYCIIVPTKALINELKSDLINMLNSKLEHKNYRVVTNIHSIALKEQHHFIFIFTPERLLYYLIQYNIPIDHLFVDEAHKISENDGRSTFYYKVINLLLDKNNDAKITFTSPNIPNPEVYLKLLPNFKKPMNHILTTSYSPVTQIKFLIDFTVGMFYVYNQYKKEFLKLNNIHNISDLTDIINYFGKDKQNLIYCSSKDSAISNACHYAKNLIYLNDEDLEDLSTDITNNIHYSYFLADLVKKGIAYHIGYLPSSIREKIEKLFELGKIKTIFCTSTLVEGVNLPADNLFITSSYNGISKLSEVDLKNLTGRVGRIKYSTYGNVFFIKNFENFNRDKFEIRMMEEIPQQNLSIHNNLNKKQKEFIVNNLKNGNIEFISLKNQSDNNFQLMRKTAIMLLNEIIFNKMSYIYRQFENYLNVNVINSIKTSFKKYYELIDDDINISLDQSVNLRRAITTTGISYPNSFSFENIYSFMLQLSQIFKWEIYEQKTLGCINKNLKEPRRLRYYSVVLSKWMQGNSIKDIIESSIEYKRKHPENSIEINNTYVRYDGSSEHNNKIIGDTLNTIEHIILFKIANYFLKFSNEYKKIKNNGNSISNDWYEFVEYGSNNALQIYLQQIGFSRETAIYIYKNRYRYIEYDEKPKIKISILDCDSKSILKEIEEIKFNMPEVFV